MKQFLAVFMGSATGEKMMAWKSLDDATRSAKETEGKIAWGKWVEKNKNAIVFMGSPLGKTKKVDPRGISDIKNLMAAYTVIQAESHEAAAKIFENHPHFTIFPGDSVEIMESLPIPGQS